MSDLIAWLHSKWPAPHVPSPYDEDAFLREYERCRALMTYAPKGDLRVVDTAS